MVLVCSWNVAVATAPSEPALAYWVQHHEIEYLKDLPRQYSCNELYYKYRDILEQLGARAGARIDAFGCNGTPGTSSRDSTRVELLYQIPERLPAAVSGPAVFKARLGTVRFAPGHPRSLQSDDCALVREVRTLLLPSIGAQVKSSHLECSTAQAGHGSYSLVTQVWRPLTD